MEGGEGLDGPLLSELWVLGRGEGAGGHPTPVPDPPLYVGFDSPGHRCRHVGQPPFGANTNFQTFEHPFWTVLLWKRGPTPAPSPCLKGEGVLLRKNISAEQPPTPFPSWVVVI